LSIPVEGVAPVEEDLCVTARHAYGRLTGSREPFEVDADDAFVQVVREAAGAGSGVGVSFWADSGLIAAAGIPTVLYGPVGDGAHAKVEWVDLDSLERVRDVVLAVATDWCA
jgi:acetylornithine deacetylase